MMKLKFTIFTTWKFLFNASFEALKNFIMILLLIVAALIFAAKVKAPNLADLSDFPFPNGMCPDDFIVTNSKSLAL